jgi:rhodanese-related sulfurtransferase
MDTTRTCTRKWLAPLVVMVALALAVAAVPAALALGTASAASPRLVSPAQFALVVAQKGTVTIDVRGPGSPYIKGTDLSIAFDKLVARRAKLPAKTTRLAVYCQSGHRSAIAVTTLVKLGYRDIVQLRGGANAWAAAGRPLITPRV